MIPIDDVVIFDCITSTPSTSAAVDADSAPVFDVFEEDTDTPILAAQTMTKRTSKTGNYRGSFTASAANGFEAGKWYNVIASGIVGGVTGKTTAMRFRVAPAETAAGVPKVDPSHLLGTAISTPATAGILDVNVKNIDNDAASASGTVTFPNATLASTTGAVGSVTGAVGSVTAGVSLADGAITAAKIASDAFAAAKFAADFFTAIITAVWTTAVSRTLSAFGFSVTVGTNSDKTGYELTSAYDPAKTAAQAGDTMTLTAAYDAAKTAASQSSVNTVNTNVGFVPAAAAAAVTTDHGVGSYVRNTEPTVPPTTAEIADKYLGRNIAGGSDGGRTVSSSLQMIRNRVVFKDDLTFDVYAEDDTTIAWSGTFVRADKTAIVSVNPA